MKSRENDPKSRILGLHPPLAVALIYLLYGVLWISFSDRVVAQLATSSEQFHFFSVIKGKLFVGITALLFYVILQRVEKKRQRGRKLLEYVVDGIPDLVWMKDETGRFQLCNRSFEKLLNRSREDIIDHTDYDLFPKKTADFYRERDFRALENQLPTVNEEAVVNEDGKTESWFETIKTPMYDDQRKLIGILGIARDISLRKEALEQSRERQEFLNAIVDRSPFPMWVGSPEGILLRANEALCRALNLSAEQLVGKYNIRQDDNFKRQDIAEKISRVFSQHKPVRFDVLWKSEAVQKMDIPEGQNFYLDVTVFPLLNPDGELNYIVTQWLDISDRKKNENTLKRQNAELEQFNKLAVGRELRMVELKKEINALCRELGRESPYA